MRLRQPGPLRTRCNRLHPCYSEPIATNASGRPTVYVCNCNGLRQRDVARAIEAGATRPREVFQRNQCEAQCAKCVCEMRQMISESREAFALAAE
jgi:bacterioferritin-associated ferredoxin